MGLFKKPWEKDFNKLRGESYFKALDAAMNAIDKIYDQTVLEAIVFDGSVQNESLRCHAAMKLTDQTAIARYLININREEFSYERIKDDAFKNLFERIKDESLLVLVAKQTESGVIAETLGKRIKSAEAAAQVARSAKTPHAVLGVLPLLDQETLKHFLYHREEPFENVQGIYISILREAIVSITDVEILIEYLIKTGAGGYIYDREAETRVANLLIKLKDGSSEEYKTFVRLVSKYFVRLPKRKHLSLFGFLQYLPIDNDLGKRMLEYGRSGHDKDHFQALAYALRCRLVSDEEYLTHIDEISDAKWRLAICRLSALSVRCGIPGVTKRLLQMLENRKSNGDIKGDYNLSSDAAYVLKEMYKKGICCEMIKPYDNKTVMPHSDGQDPSCFSRHLDWSARTFRLPGNLLED